MVRVEFSTKHVLLIIGLVLFCWIVYLVRGTVVLLSIAAMLMATLHPLVQMAKRRGLSHGQAVAVVMLGLVLAPIAIVGALSPLIISEVQDFAHNIPSLQHHINELLRNAGLATQVNNAIDRVNLQDRIANLAVVSAAPTIGFVAAVFEVVVVAGYLLADSRRLRLVLHEFVPRSSERHIEPLLDGMERVVGGYIRGQLLTSALFGVFAFLLCLALGVPYPLLLGIIAAIGDVIPLFGVQVAMAITALVAFTHSSWQPVAVIAGYLAYGQVESHLLVPRIYARTVNLSPLMVIVATIIGAKLYGVVGILIGIPIVGVLKVIFDYIVAERMRGRPTAEAEMESEPTDPIGREETAEEGKTSSESDDEPGEDEQEGIPEPTYSPFESVPTEQEVEPEPSSAPEGTVLERESPLIGQPVTVQGSP
ncbi:MAG: AI-2E family transporter [Dehalococcoidia bacterium]